MFQCVLLVLSLLPMIPAEIQIVFVMAGIAVVGFGFCFGMMVHENSLCEPCIAEMPLNGSQKAEDWDRYLAAFHWLFRVSSRRFLIIWVSWLFFVTVSNHTLPDQISGVLNFIPATGMLVLLMRHSRVEPWCKRCKWGRGGKEEWVPSPTPDPAASK